MDPCAKTTEAIFLAQLSEYLLERHPVVHVRGLNNCNHFRIGLQKLQQG